MGLFKVRLDLVLFLKVRFFFFWFMGWLFFRNNKFFLGIGVTCSEHGLF